MTDDAIGLPQSGGRSDDRVLALVVAAGRGTRVGGDAPKQYRKIGGKPILLRTVEKLAASPLIDHVQVVIHRDDEDRYREAISHARADGKLLPPVTGGATRQQSVLCGLRAIEVLQPAIVLIHDAARPFVTHSIISACIEAVVEGRQGAVAAVPVADTLKRSVAGTQLIGDTVERKDLYRAQTPQGFQYAAIRAAHERAAEADRAALTDDAAVAEWAGYDVVLSPGDPANIKITTQEDLMQADHQCMLETLASLADIRVATAYDVHAFEPGDHVMLGGIPIPHTKGLKGHSDADVVLHALTDAVLAALCDGDIGAHFPPSDPQWRGASSDRFLAFAAERVRARGGLIAHLDATIVCESPRIGPHRDPMRARIARICDLPAHRVSVKATTSERLGFTGRKEGIAALASATLRLPFEEVADTFSTDDRETEK